MESKYPKRWNRSDHRNIRPHQWHKNYPGNRNESETKTNVNKNLKPKFNSTLLAIGIIGDAIADLPAQPTDNKSDNSRLLGIAALATGIGLGFVALIGWLVNRHKHPTQ